MTAILIISFVGFAAENEVKLFILSYGLHTIIGYCGTEKQYAQ